MTTWSPRVPHPPVTCHPGGEIPRLKGSVLDHFRKLVKNINPALLTPADRCDLIDLLDAAFKSEKAGGGASNASLA